MGFAAPIILPLLGLNKLFGDDDDNTPQAPTAPTPPTVETAALPEDEREAEAAEIREEEEAEAKKNTGLAGTQYTKMPSLLNSLMDSAKKNKLG